jgi:hypothetical protein
MQLLMYFHLIYPGHFLLTALLIQPLKAAAPSRVVVLSSKAYKRADKLAFDEMNFSHFSEKSFNQWAIYGRSKLYNILFARELAKRLEGMLDVIFLHSLSLIPLSCAMHLGILGMKKVLLYTLLTFPPKPGSGVTTYSLHPGVIATELQRHWFTNPVTDAFVRIATWPVFKDIPHGAQTTICVAVDPALASESGKYYS